MPAKGSKIVIDPETGERRVVKGRKAKNATPTHAESSRTPGMGNTGSTGQNNIGSDILAPAALAWHKAHAANARLTMQNFFDQLKPLMFPTS